MSSATEADIEKLRITFIDEKRAIRELICGLCDDCLKSIIKCQCKKKYV